MACYEGPRNYLYMWKYEEKALTDPDENFNV